MNNTITRNIPRRGAFLQLPEKRGAIEKEDWTQYRIDSIRDRAYTNVILLGPWEIREAYNLGLKKYRYVDKKWHRIRLGEKWGRRNRTAFFRIDFVIPESFRGQRVVSDLMLGGESIVRINGVLSGGLDPNRTMLILADPAKGGEKIKIETETHVWSYPDDKRTGTQGDRHPISRSYLATLDTEIEGAYFDFAAPLEVMKAYKEKNIEVYNFLLFHLHAALNIINRCTENVKIFKETLKRARAYLYKNIYRSDAFRKAGKIHAVGQAHLDIAFFWQKKDGIRKNLRTSLVQIDLLKRYPEYIFCQSQPALFEALKEYEPSVYKEVQKAVSAGRWEMIGGLYIECDCNLISGESFVRQFLYGKDFFRKEFNIDTRTCWLPDVFGNCGSMPQIMKKCGIDYFLTNKHSVWNDTNRLPHNIFWWQGIDGTRVLSFIPSVHFNGSMLPDHLLLNWDKFTDKEVHPVSLYQFGWGDGGGGATYEQLEFAKRLKRFPGMPRIEIGKAENYFKEVKKKSGDKLSVWKDDLYLETHRGTYTHKGMIKKLNRKSELMLHNAEIFAGLSIPYGNKYPKEKFRALWRKKLTNDFHDILPGTHVESVTREAENDYRDCIRIANQETARSLNVITRHIDTRGDGIPIMVWNPLNWTRTDLAQVVIKQAWRDFAIYDEDGQQMEYQIIDKKDHKLNILFVARNVPSIGYKVFFMRKVKPVFRDTPKSSKTKLENKFFRILLNRDGTFPSFYDKTNKRELLPNGKKGNQFILFEDRPGQYDSWDLVLHQKEVVFNATEILSANVLENGPLRSVLRLKQKISRSILVQDIVLYSCIPRVDFEMHVDWKERQRFLQVAYPFDINTNKVTTEIPFGTIERPTHQNTSWDIAKHEVPVHRWVDISEWDYGVSLINESKYGCDVRNNTVRLSLLKSAVSPDPKADLGKHDFIYSIYPHRGTWREGKTIQMAHGFNNPFIAYQSAHHKGSLLNTSSFLEINAPNVVLEAIKIAENSDDLVIRLYETFNKKTHVQVKFLHPMKSIRECNMIEEEEFTVRFNQYGFDFEIKPYEIRSFKVRYFRDYS